MVNSIHTITGTKFWTKALKAQVFSIFENFEKVPIRTVQAED